ncbi:methyltransferase type 11 [Halobellus salinus]|uniref:Methyltransferase type 11 n=1 Tax=Halobellus salinus TaxID=931585 RepID=A0A830ETH6_9EURY|nr:class I SAM-dependent methyltransferase [Halobellus salinus]GGJ16262.1 methyltransferase type 11 [Halobellus salinus]SMP30485.1 Ubiquinone/menaquinone biosynthesis C-methylase UbiE [Halobellus salinus]
MDRTDVRQAWDAVADAYASHRDPTGSDADLLSTLRDELGPAPTVLDVGCGDGARTLANLPDGSVGLDISRRGVELAAEEVPEARLVQAAMRDVPLRADSVDAVTAYHAVFHVPRAAHPDVYREFARVLRPGGRLLMTLPSGRFETVRDGWMGGRMLFSAPGRDATLAQLRDAGFTDIRTETVSDPLGSAAEFAFATASDG